LKNKKQEVAFGGCSLANYLNPSYLLSPVCHKHWATHLTVARFLAWLGSVGRQPYGTRLLSR